MEHQGFGYPATDAEGATTVQPERGLQPGDPNLVGAAPVDEKKGIAERVKGMMGRHGRKKHGAQKKDATASTETQESATKGGILGKIKAKAGSKVGHDEDGSKHGPARLLSMSSSSSMSSSDEEDVGTVGFAMDPTGPAVAGSSLGRQDFSSAPQGPGADFSDLNLNSDANGEMDQHSERAADFAKSSNPMNPNYGESHHSHPTQTSNSNLTPSKEAHGEPHHSHPTETSNDSNLTPNEDANGEQHHSRPTEADNSNQTASEYGEPHPTNPTGTTNSQGGAVLGDHHGNLHEGPRDDNVKQEGFVAKIMDKFHSPKEEPAATTTTTTA